MLRPVLGKLKERQGKQEGTRAMIEALMLGREYGYEQLERAVAEALALGCCDVSAVRLLLHSVNTAERRSAEPVEIGELSCYDRPQPRMNEYDQLLRNWSGGEVVQ